MAIYSDYQVKKYKKKTYPQSLDYAYLEKYLADHFYELMKLYHAENSFKINKMAASRYDLFADGCLDILDTNDDFVYIDEKETGKYICGRIKQAMKRFSLRNYRQPLSLSVDEIKFNALLNHFGCRQ